MNPKVTRQVGLNSNYIFVQFLVINIFKNISLVTAATHKNGIYIIDTQVFN